MVGARLLVHADVPRHRSTPTARWSPSTCPGSSGRRRDEEREAEQTVAGRAARARVHAQRRPLRAARRGGADRLGPPVVLDHRPGPAGPGAAAASRPRRPRTPPGRATRSACSTRSGPTCRCASNACGRWRSWRASQADYERAAGTLAGRRRAMSREAAADDRRRQPAGPPRGVATMSIVRWVLVAVTALVAVGSIRQLPRRVPRRRRPEQQRRARAALHLPDAPGRSSRTIRASARSAA